MYLVISLLVLRAGYGIRLYLFLIIAYPFTFQMSPGKYTATRSSKMNKQLLKRKIGNNTAVTKRRRLELKSDCISSNATKKIREGETYSTGIALEKGHLKEDIICKRQKQTFINTHTKGNDQEQTATPNGKIIQ